MPVLARAAAATLLGSGFRFAGLPGLGGAPPSAFNANVGNQDDFGDQSPAEYNGNRWLDRVFYPVSVIHLMGTEET